MALRPASSCEESYGGEKPSPASYFHGLEATSRISMCLTAPFTCARRGSGIVNCHLGWAPSCDRDASARRIQNKNPKRPLSTQVCPSFTTGDCRRLRRITGNSEVMG